MIKNKQILEDILVRQTSQYKKNVHTRAKAMAVERQAKDTAIHTKVPPKRPNIF